jgi:hypothetical protein
MTKYITRKDIARMLECSVDQVRHNEVRWGIIVAKRNLGTERVRYLRDECVKIFKSTGLLDYDDADIMDKI